MISIVSAFLFAEVLAPPTAVGGPLDASTTLFVVEDHRAPMVYLEITFPAGTASPWFRDQHGEEAWGYQMYDADGALRARADALAADIGFWSDSTSSSLSLSCLKSDLPAAMTLLKDILANTSYDKKELKRAGQGEKINYETWQKDPQAKMGEAGARLFFAEGDARLLPYEKPGKVSRDAAELAATRDAILRLPGRIVGFAGDIDRATAEATIAGLLPEAGAAPADLEPVLLPINAERAAVEVAMPNLTQVYMAYAREGMTFKDADYPALLVADHVLGGHFYSRLYVALRHESGDTYGAGTFGGGTKWVEGYGAWTFTRTDNRESTRAKLQETVKIFGEKGITEEERADAVANLVGSQLFDVQTPWQILGTAMWEKAEGLAPGFDAEAVRRAGALSLSEVNAFIQRFYDPAAFTMVEVIPEG